MTVLHLPPLGMEGSHIQMLPSGGKAILGDVGAKWRERYSVSVAIGDLLFHGGLLGVAEDGRYNEAIKRANITIDAELSSKKDCFLLIETRTPLNEGTISYYDLGDVGVSIDDPLATFGSGMHDEHVASALGNLLVLLPPEWSVSAEKIYACSIVDTGHNEVHLRRILMGTPTLRTAGRLNAQALTNFGNLIAAYDPLATGGALKMLRASALDGQNELEVFLFTWTGLEFLINALFDTKYKAPFDDLAQAAGAHDSRQLLSAIPGHAQLDKRRITFKFLACIYVLDQTRLTSFFNRFDPLRDFRNGAFHEAQIKELARHTEGTRGLLLDLLRLHNGA